MNKKTLSEQDIHTNYITPGLQKAGWKGGRMREEVYFTDGRMIVRGQMATRGERKRADYLLYCQPNLLFFEKGRATEAIWYFERPMPTDRKQYSKTRPIELKEFELEKSWWAQREEHEYAWWVSLEEIRPETTTWIARTLTLRRPATATRTSCWQRTRPTWSRLRHSVRR